ncbi:MAG: alpha/beta fold hydrolase [Alkalinema sp. RU_4_3]|nr:alpha/beta fold hydrolase [Alkalinema sp. RU_4_3]
MPTTADRHPVILVHGLWDTAHVFKSMRLHLETQGWDVYSLDLLPSNGSAPLDVLAHQLEHYIAKTFAPDQTLDIVGYSMGGLVSRYYLQRLGGLDRVARFITLSAPHKGTLAATFSRFKGCQQMHPKHPFIQDLNRDLHQLEQVQFTSLWTPYDAIILPSTSSILPVGKTERLNVPLHKFMVSDRRSLAAITRALAEPLRHPQSSPPPPSQTRPPVGHNA